MFPHEMQALMAKILFFVFAMLMLAMGQVRAADIVSHSSSQVQVIQIL